MSDEEHRDLEPKQTVLQVTVRKNCERLGTKRTLGVLYLEHNVFLEGLQGYLIA
jgi:hypothetical protein